MLHNQFQIEEAIWLPAARQCLTDTDREQVMRSIRVLQEATRSTAEAGNTDTSSTREFQRILISARPRRARPLQQTASKTLAASRHRLEFAFCTCERIQRLKIKDMQFVAPDINDLATA